MKKLLISILFLFSLIGCNPERVEKLGHSLEKTANVLDLLAPVLKPVDRYIHQKVYDYEYKGEYKDGKRHGYGTYIWKDKELKGQKYVGYFKNDKIHGKGTLTSKDGHSFVGEFKNDKRHGLGTIHFPNGDKFIGEFKNNISDGEGTYIYSNGTKTEGIWKNGIYLNAKPSYKTEYSNKSDCDPTISSWCKEQQTKNSSETQLSNDNSKHSHSHSSNVVNVSEKEELGFWGKTDLFLGKIADGVSKEDMITGLRTLDKPFHNEEDYRRQGQQTLNLILNKARKDKVKIYSQTDPQYILSLIHI